MKFQTNSRVRAASIAMLLMTVAMPAYAADDAAAASDAASDANGPDGGVIIVTATKRETDLQKTPIAISVVGAVALKDHHIQSLIDLGDGSVPSLRIATFEARQSALTVGIRGIVPFDQNQTARDTGVGVYIDGIYLGRSQGLNAALFDVERIEVLKGPQGTLFGRNTEGGAVSIVTRQPTGEFDGRASAGVGNYGSYTGEIHLDLPAVANVALKFDGVTQHQNPTVRNPLAGQAGWDQYNRYGGRVTALWKPIDGFSAKSPTTSRATRTRPSTASWSTTIPRARPWASTTRPPVASSRRAAQPAPPPARPASRRSRRSSWSPATRA